MLYLVLSSLVLLHNIFPYFGLSFVCFSPPLQANFWSSFAAECIYWEEKRLKKYQEAYVRDIPILDKKASLLISELEGIKKMFVDYSREVGVMANEIGNEVGKFTFAETIRCLERRRVRCLLSLC